MNAAKALLPILALLVLGLFVWVWGSIAIDLLQYEPTGEKPTLELSEGRVVVGGFLASAVGAGTAAVLGIEIKKAMDSNRAFAVSLAQGFANSLLLVAGVLVYAGIGALVLVAYVEHSDAAPDVVEAFALGALGWLGGAFTAVFKSS